MKEIFSRLKIPIIIIAVLFALLITYNVFVKKPVTKTLLKTTSQTGVGSPETNFLPILLQIQAVTLDEKLFLDPVFRALVDWGQPIVPESVGKQNPFSGASGSLVNSSVESLGFTDDSSTTTKTSSDKSTQTKGVKK